MAEVFLNPMFTALNGRIGGLVFYSHDNKTYVRSYVVPRNPDTPAQRKNRNLFRDAMKAWQALSRFDKAAYARRARRLGMTGHNLFISRHMAPRRKNTGSKGPENIPGRDIHSLRRPFSSLHRRGHSVPASIQGHGARHGAPAPALRPGGP